MIKKYFKSLLYLYIEKEKKLNTVLSNMPDKQCINFIDIGASGGLEPRWKAIEKHISYYGFEPDKRSIDELNQKLAEAVQNEDYETAANIRDEISKRS